MRDSLRPQMRDRSSHLSRSTNVDDDDDDEILPREERRIDTDWTRVRGRTGEDCNKLTGVSRSSSRLTRVRVSPLIDQDPNLNTPCQRYAGKVLVCVTGSNVIANVEAHHILGHCLTARVCPPCKRSRPFFFPRAGRKTRGKPLCAGEVPDEIVTLSDRLQ